MKRVSIGSWAYTIGPYADAPVAFETVCARLREGYIIQLPRARKYVVIENNMYAPIIQYTNTTTGKVYIYI